MLQSPLKFIPPTAARSSTRCITYPSLFFFLHCRCLLKSVANLNFNVCSFPQQPRPLCLANCLSWLGCPNFESLVEIWWYWINWHKRFRAAIVKASFGEGKLIEFSLLVYRLPSIYKFGLKARSARLQAKWVSLFLVYTSWSWLRHNSWTHLKKRKFMAVVS
jgi:hypothetical protein